jgi:nucleoid-associated protein YgaU
MRTPSRAPRSRTLLLVVALVLTALLPNAVAGTVLDRDAGVDAVRASIAVQRDDRDASFAATATAGSRLIADFTEWWPASRAAAIERAIAQRDAAAKAAAAEAAAAAPQTAPVARSAVAPAKRTTAKATYSGHDRLWIPAFGMSRSVSTFSCSRSTPPANYVYRWGCAGQNNVYLFGHAWGVMKPLHDAYYAHRLKVGMRVVYADHAGRVRTYAVTTWRVVSPADTAWAIAAQSRPSMTLQTCVGANSQYRLLVRLVAIS